jgi:hypothetical protein
MRREASIGALDKSQAENRGPRVTITSTSTTPRKPCDTQNKRHESVGGTGEMNSKTTPH